MNATKEKTSFGKSQLDPSEIKERITIGISLNRAKTASDKEYNDLREQHKLNEVKGYRYCIVAEFVAMKNEGIFQKEYIYRTHWSTLVVLASKPENIEIHRMLLHLVHYGMLRADKNLPVSPYSIASNSTTVPYIMKNKSPEYIKAMFARARLEAGVQLTPEEFEWLEWEWEPLVIEKTKNIKNIAEEMTQDIEEVLDLNFEQDGAEFPLGQDLAYIDPERESAVIRVFANQNNQNVASTIENIIQAQLEKHFGNITAPDAEELRVLRAENEILRNKLYDILIQIRGIERLNEDATTAAQLLIDTASTIHLKRMQDEISDILNK